MLTRLTIEGFKSIRKLENLELGRMNVLIGANGSGKSNLISFFQMLHWMVEQPGQLQYFVAKNGGASSLLFDGPAVTSQINFNLSLVVSDIAAEYHGELAQAGDDQFVFRRETRTAQCLDKDSPLAASEPDEFKREESGHRESILLDDGLMDHPLIFIIHRHIKRTATYQFHNTSDTSRIRKKCDAEDSAPLKDDAGNLAAVLLRLKVYHPRHYTRITAVIRQSAPFFADFHLEPEHGKLLLRWKELGSDVMFSSHQASDGMLRLFALVTLLMQPTADQPELIILDEPELGLHPQAIELVGGLIGAASIHKQVIVATQSPSLLNHFDPQDVITVERRGRESLFRKLDPDKLSSWLNDYSLADLWEKNVIGGGVYR